LLNTDAGVLRQIARDRPERLVEPFAQPADLLGGVLRLAQRAANGWPRGFPGGTIQQADARIGEA
jgi:hypothetical protein